MVTDNTVTPAVTTTWLYIQNFVYKNDTMQFFTHEEGRARYHVTEGTGEAKRFNFDYFSKDHLGNVRMVLTEEKDTAFYPAATIETATRTEEVKYYDIQTAQVKDKSLIANAGSYTIKIITHSMGGAYGKGFVRALKEYIRTLPLEMQRQIKIVLVADFDPYQAGDLTADPDIKTQQFIHKNNWNLIGMGWLANEIEKGDVEVAPSQNKNSDHSIFSFIDDVMTLAPGDYEWDGTRFKKL